VRSIAQPATIFNPRAPVPVLKTVFNAISDLEILNPTGRRKVGFLTMVYNANFLAADRTMSGICRTTGMQGHQTVSRDCTASPNKNITGLSIE
jgi:hypothetical protein